MMESSIGTKAFPTPEKLQSHTVSATFALAPIEPECQRPTSSERPARHQSFASIRCTTRDLAYCL